MTIPDELRREGKRKKSRGKKEHRTLLELRGHVHKNLINPNIILPLTCMCVLMAACAGTVVRAPDENSMLGLQFLERFAGVWHRCILPWGIFCNDVRPTSSL